MFLSPANAEFCPDNYDQKVLLIDEKLLEEEIEWTTTSIKEPWNCKYHI